MRVRVITQPVGEGVVDDRRINWHNSSDRRWLANHTHHCMMNGKGITYIPESN